jgi:hypothetical protein
MVQQGQRGLKLSLYELPRGLKPSPNGSAYRLQYFRLFLIKGTLGFISRFFEYQLQVSQVASIPCSENSAGAFWS